VIVPLDLVPCKQAPFELVPCKSIGRDFLPVVRPAADELQIGIQRLSTPGLVCRPASAVKLALALPFGSVTDQRVDIRGDSAARTRVLRRAIADFSRGEGTGSEQTP
jgi:hypothetical protein